MRSQRSLFMRILFGRTLLVPAALVAVTNVASAAGALDTIKQKNNEVDKLLRQKVERGSAADKQVQADVKKLASSFIDYGELARRSLGDQWGKLSPKQRTDFVTVFEKMVESRYVGQLRTNLDYEVKYKGEQLAGNDATVASTVKVKTEGKSSSIDIVYKLHKTEGEWRIVDVVTDELSLAAQYRDDFTKIITAHGYDELYRRLQKKADNTP